MVANVQPQCPADGPSTDMAWHCSGRTNQELVRNLRLASIVKSARVEAAMMAVDRGDFAPTNPYQDSPQLLGHDVTISAPHMHAHALQLLEGQLREGARALDVGSGSGYLTVAMAHMVGAQGIAVGLDHLPQLVQLSKDNTAKNHHSLLASGRVEYHLVDGHNGFAARGPYDAIHVGAAASHVPEALVQQLKPGGRMIIPVGVNSQSLVQVDKQADGKVVKRDLFGVMYVPLIPAGAKQ